jgi:hypothetical protein
VPQIERVERVRRARDLLAAYSAEERAEVERMAVARFLDADYYCGRYPRSTAGVDPFEHFRTRGWREFRRPSVEFDTTWYWSAYLDPAADDVNPLVHYALLGQDEGLRTHAPFVEPQESAPLGSGARRAVLFAGYDPDGIVDDVVVAYLTELSRHADVFYLSDGEMRAGELAKLADVTVGAWAVRHGAYDFGSYSLLARDLVGWDRLAEYDEVLLVNDSCYLLGSLDQVFDEMAQRTCSWWGLQATELTASPYYGETVPMETIWGTKPALALASPISAERVPGVIRDMFANHPEQEFHIGSYFVGLRRPVLADETFRHFLSSVRAEFRKADVIERYELGLTRLLISRGHRFETFVPELYPFHPVYSEWAFEIIHRGCPLIKRALLATNPFGIDLRNWHDRLRQAVPAAGISDIDAHLRRTSG